MSNEATDDDLLTPEATAEMLDKGVSTLERWRADGSGPPFCRIGKRSVRYRLGDLRAWIAQRTFAHHAAEAAGKPNGSAPKGGWCGSRRAQQSA